MNYNPGNISFESSNIALEAENGIFLELCSIYSALVDKMQTELNVLTNVAEGYKKLDAAFDENASILNLNFDSVVIDPIQISEEENSDNENDMTVNPSDENSTSEPGNSSEENSNKGSEVPSSDGTGGPGEEPVLPPDSSNAENV